MASLRCYALIRLLMVSLCLLLLLATLQVVMGSRPLHNDCHGKGGNASLPPPPPPPLVNSTKGHHHKWVGPSGYRHITVDIGGDGDYISVQAAVDAVPDNNMVNVVIHIRPGLYM